MTLVTFQHSLSIGKRSRPSKSRVVVNSLLVAGLAGGGLVAYRSTHASSKTSVASGTVETVKKGNLLATVSSTGNIESATATALSFSQSGTVQQISVVKGQSVKAGDVLAVLDDSAQQSALDNAKTALRSAQARAQKTLSGLTGVERQQNSVMASQSQQQVISAQTSLNNASASATANKRTYRLAIEQADASLASANSALALAREKQTADNVTSATSVDTARAAIATSQASVDHNNATAQTNVASAQATLDDAAALLSQYRSNMSAAQSSYDTKAGVKDLTWSELTARYQDAQTSCKASITTTDEITCAQAQYLASLAQTGQKQESTVSSGKTALTNAQNTQTTTKLTGEQTLTNANNALTTALNSQRTSLTAGKQSVTNAENSLTSAKNALDNARNSESTGLLKDQQTVRNASESVTSAKRSLDVQVAANRVKEKPATADQLASDQSQIASAEDQVKKAEENLADTVLRAPVSGTVAQVNGEIGDTVTAGGAKAFVTLTDGSSLRVKVGFSEADAIRIRVGQAAKVTIDSAPDRVFTGKITSLDPIQTVVSNVVTYYATVNLVGDLDGLRVGMSTSVDVTVDQRSDVLTLSSRAITGKGATGTVLVRTLKKDAKGKEITTDAPAQVGIGLRADDGVEIVSGLSEGQQIVLPAASGGFSLPGGFKPPAGGFGGGLG